MNLFLVTQIFTGPVVPREMSFGQNFRLLEIKCWLAVILNDSFGSPKLEVLWNSSYYEPNDFCFILSCTFVYPHNLNFKPKKNEIE